MKSLLFASVATTVATSLLVTSGALAQEPYPGAAAAPAPAPAPAPLPPPPAPAPAPAAQAQFGTAAPAGAAMPAPEATAAPGNSDHDAVVGRLAFGYLGRRTMSVGAMTPGVAAPAPVDTPFQTVEAPVVGMRFWLSSMLGLDAGIGFSTTSAGTKQEVANVSVTNDLPGFTAFIVHGGVPLALANTGHFSFQIVPELNVGYATGKVETNPTGLATTTVTHTGIHLDVGARAGAELHFGFIGVPQLSLQGSVGVRLDWEQGQTETEVTGQAPLTVTWHAMRLATATYDNPWNIFTSNVAALYYF